MLDGKRFETVALFVDYEYLQRCMPCGTAPVTDLLQEVLTRVRDRGVVLIANAYADWEQFPGMQVEMKRLQLDPRFILPGPHELEQISVTRSTCSAMTMALDAIQTLYERDEIETFALVTGERGFYDLVGRLKRHRKTVVLFGFEKNTAELARAVCVFSPLDEFVETDPNGDHETPPFAEEGEPALADKFDWEPFIQLMNRLEQHLPFVSLKYLKNNVLNTMHGCSNSQESKAGLIRDAIRMKFLETYKIPNPRNPNFPTTACRLNRRHPDVRSSLD